MGINRLTVVQGLLSGERNKGVTSFLEFLGRTSLDDLFLPLNN